MKHTTAPVVRPFTISPSVLLGDVGPALPSDYRKTLKEGDKRAICMVKSDGLLPVKRGDLIIIDQEAK